MSTGTELAAGHVAVIADKISPIIGWRVWLVDIHGSLFSPRYDPDTPWPGFEKTRAFCSGCSDDTSGLRFKHPTHAPPLRDGRCGLYAVKPGNVRQLLAFFRVFSVPVRYPYYVAGEIALFGTVVEHAEGYRAAYGYPIRLYLPAALLPKLGPLLKARYGIPVVSDRPLRKLLSRAALRARVRTTGILSGFFLSYLVLFGTLLPHTLYTAPLICLGSSLLAWLSFRVSQRLNLV